MLASQVISCSLAAGEFQAIICGIGWTPPFALPSSEDAEAGGGLWILRKVVRMD
jgi:hypothetical protein